MELVQIGGNGLIFNRKLYGKAGSAFDVLEPFGYSDENIYSTTDEEAAALKIEGVLEVLAAVSKDDVVNSRAARSRVLGELKDIVNNPLLPKDIRTSAEIAIDYISKI